jgi:hypothetical protein
MLGFLSWDGAAVAPIFGAAVGVLATFAAACGAAVAGAAVGALASSEHADNIEAAPARNPATVNE